MILTKAGILAVASKEENLENFESIHRYTTLSAVRRAAEIHFREASKIATEKAIDKDKTSAEKIFEEELANGEKKDQVA